MSIDVPEIRVHPDWISLLHGEFTLRAMDMMQPQVRLKSWRTAGGGPEPQLPAGTKIRIRRGHIILPVEEQHQSLLGTDSVTLENITGEIIGEMQSVRLKLAAGAAFSDRLVVEGKYFFPAYSFDFLVRSEGLQLHKTITSLVEGQLQPVESKVNIGGHLTGSGPDNFKLDLQGDFPCFLAKPKDRAVLFNCGVTDLTFIRKGGDLELHINKFKVKDPGITLSGQVIRRMGPNGDAPLWHLDLGAEDVDLTEIRKAVLTLWGDSHLARTVCNTVRGGRASRAAYRFAGPATEFRHIEAMTITATADKVDVHVPNADLDLTEADGPITISEGYLSGQNLSARLNNSTGRNASLLLDLTSHRSRAFELDIDIDADLSALPPILARLVHHSTFQAELSRFSEVQGRGSGHLHLGETLNDLKVDVDIEKMTANGRYDRLRRLITIQEGTLRVAPQRVTWQGVRGELGPHHLDASDGSVTWADGEPQLMIEKFQGSLDGRELYDELAANGLLPGSVAEKLSELDGVIRVDSASFAGPAHRPGQWTYTLNVSLSGLNWYSPLLPEKVVIESGNAIIGQNSINLSEAKVRFLDQFLTVRGEFEHHLLDQWQGLVWFDGTVEDRLGSWVGDKGWVPELFQPRLPVTLQNFQLAWQDSKVTEVSGTIEAGAGEPSSPSVYLDLFPGPDILKIADLSILDGERLGKLTLEKKQGQDEHLQFAWQGVVTADTMDRLLENGGLLSGRLDGDFEVLLTGGHAEDRHLTGMAEISELRWRRPEETVNLSIPVLRLQGNGDRLSVERIELEAGGNRLSGHGTALPTLHELTLDLDVTAPALTWKTVSDLITEFHRFGAPSGKQGTEEDKAEKDRPATLSGGSESTYRVTGRVGFDLASFTSAAAALKIGGKEAPPYVWQPFQGEILLQPNSEITVNVSRANLCCLDMTGSWHRDRNREISIDLSLATTCESPRFESILPCIGIQQNFIEGECNFRARLQGSPTNWRNGAVTIDSEDGQILRLRLLSRIFKVVNLTDLFTPSDLPEMDGKGFSFKDLQLVAEISDNILYLQKGVIRAEGLNLFGSGQMDLQSMRSDFTVFIAPFKTIDAIIGKVPLVSRIIGGDSPLVAIPVGVSGDIRDPEAKVLAPDAVGESALNVLRETLMLPFNILFPILPGQGNQEPSAK